LPSVKFEQKATKVTKEEENEELRTDFNHAHKSPSVPFPREHVFEEINDAANLYSLGAPVGVLVVEPMFWPEGRGTA
jgi:hypothetical protein